jgi:hypothetical protein
MNGRIAINVADLIASEATAFVAGILLGDCRGPTVTVDKSRVDGTALVINADEQRARAIVEILRRRVPKLRAYEQNGKSWKRI